MKVYLALFLCSLQVFCAQSSPTFVVQKSVSASTALEGSAGVGGPIAFESDKAGVNVAGFHAAVGVDAATGGLRAEADAAANSGVAAGAAAGGYASAGASAGGSGTYGHRTYHRKTEVVAEKTFTETPKVVNEQTIQGAAQVQRTVIEKTVIPQYVEKTIQVPSYVEKTIRVPTVVEHKVRVPVTPKIVENTYEENGHAYGRGHAHANIGGYKHASFSAHAGAGANTNVDKVVLEERPVATVQKQYNGYYGGNGAGGFQASGHVYKNGGLLGNIFSIPVATLGAVGNLLNSFGQAGASVSVNKRVSAGAY